MILGFYCIALYCIYPFILRFSQHEPFRSVPDHSNRHCVGVYTSKHYRATANEELAQGPYVAARPRFEPATLRSKGIDSTNAQSCPTEKVKLSFWGGGGLNP